MPITLRKRQKGGFTLVELLVVIATISVLLAVLLPSFGKVKSLALRLKCAHNLKQINLAVNLYVNSNDDIYPCAQDPLPGGYWLWMGRGWRSFIEPYLGGETVAEKASVFLCPSDKTDPNKYEATSYAYSMCFYHGSSQIDSLDSVSETYGVESVKAVPQRCFNVAHPSGKILFGEWGSHHYRIEEDNGWWCWDGKRNYLFADGHINFIEAKKINEARDGLPNANLTFKGIKGIDFLP